MTWLRDGAGIDGVRIAGCLSPLYGSYHPQIAPDYETLLATYREIVEQQGPHVDYIMCETMASVKEARACAIAAKESGKPVLVALLWLMIALAICAAGSPVSLALAALDEIGVDAKLLNCSQPESINASWVALTQHVGPFGAYANGFTSIDKLATGGTVDVLEARTDLGPVQYAEVATRWVEQGATIVGGCCEVGPEHIRVLSEQLRENGAEISGEL